MRCPPSLHCAMKIELHFFYAVSPFPSLRHSFYKEGDEVFHVIITPCLPSHRFLCKSCISLPNCFAPWEGSCSSHYSNGRTPTWFWRPFSVISGNAFILFACYWNVLCWWNSLIGLNVGLARYGMVVVQWYVMHSLERRLSVSMIDDECKVVSNFYSVLFSKRRCP
jgi:hypothetical protein